MDAFEDNDFTFLLNNAEARQRGLHISVLDMNSVQQTYHFAMRNVVIRTCLSRLHALVMRGGISVDWCTGDHRFTNVRTSTTARGDSILPDEHALYGQMGIALRWLVIFGFVPVYAPIPAVRTEPEAAEGEPGTPSTPTTGGAAVPDLGAPPTPGPYGVPSGPHVEPRLLPKFVRDAIDATRGPGRQREALISELLGTSDPSTPEGAAWDRMVVPIVQNIDSGVLVRVEDTLTGQSHLVYVPRLLGRRLQTLEAFLDYVRTSPYHVFVSPGMMPGRDGRPLSPIADLMTDAQMLAAFEANLVRADTAAAFPTLFVQEDPRADHKGETFEYEEFADALPRVLEIDGPDGAQGPGGPGGLLRHPMRGATSDYARSTRDALDAERAAARVRNNALGYGGGAQVRTEVEQRRDEAVRMGSDALHFDDTSARLYPVPTGRMLVGGPGQQARSLVNVLEWRRAFQEHACMAVGLPRAYIYHEQRASVRGSSDADLIVRQVRDTVEERRHHLKAFFQFAYRAAHEHVDNEYIANTISGLDRARDAGLEVLANEAMALAQTPSEHDLQALMREQEAVRHQFAASLSEQRGRWETARDMPAAVRASLVFNQPPMGLLADVETLAKMGAVTLDEQAVLARRVANVVGYSTCVENDMATVPPGVRERMRSIEDAALSKGARKEEPAVKRRRMMNERMEI